MGTSYPILLLVYYWVRRWKSFENRSTFGKVMGKSSLFCESSRSSSGGSRNFLRRTHYATPL